MKYLLVLCVAVLPPMGRLLAEDEKGQETAPPAAAAALSEESGSFTGSVPAGYRWLNGPQGNNQVYRSIVDVGEGPRLVDFGGSLVSSGGSLPATYYQPDVRASLPLARGLNGSDSGAGTASARDSLRTTASERNRS
ncbi:MAG: hypothetical protein ACRD8O_06570 [Bryobacteraceae bacterium]